MTTLNQEPQKAANASHWAAATAQPLAEGSSACREKVRARRTGGDSTRIKAIRSWVKQGGPGRQVALILAALLIGVPVALLVLEPLLSVVVTVLLGIVMVRALLAGGAGHESASDSNEEVDSFPVMTWKAGSQGPGVYRGNTLVESDDE
ncbi:hypothetical protein [Alloalcanivorax xenomutans]|uniref:hypothetical protein n=1 Tax=Alloalcanivorax xenomutans TaxID=1094342 RepID=UPI000C10176B|nr:hypothetical protein [Alloalcanivorax xenomutans]MCE7525750.1 hypothetical protein [Alloalcanivorax xenomutans]PHS67233.1 MAG: hypothetical protein COB00_09120 [Alcanivorax sp.]